MKYLQPKSFISDLELKMIVKTNLVSDYEKGKLDEFTSNPSYLEHMKKLKISTPTLDDYLSIFDSVFYYPSLYELKILCKIIGITSFVTRRKSKNDQDEIRTVIQVNRKSGKNNFIMFNLAFDRFNNRDLLELYVKDKELVILNRKDIGETFWDVLKAGA
jgi:hypothetical protein